MILRALYLLAFLQICHLHPTQNIKLPQLDNVSLPEEVNSLESDEPIGRSISQEKPENSIEDTVKEVEAIIKANPTLPRLTRGEILDLIENITVTDREKAKILGTNRDPKAIMVVMPYTPNADGKNMEDLYTKAPVTHIIGAEPFKTNDSVEKNEKKNSRRRPPVRLNDEEKKPGEEKKKYSASISSKFSAKTSSGGRRRRPEITTEALTTLRPSFPSTTVVPSSSDPTTYHPPVVVQRSKRPTRRRTPTTTTPFPSTTTTTTKHPNHRYPDDSLPSEGIKIIDAPKFVSSSEEDLLLQENLKEEVHFHPVLKTTTTTTQIPTIMNVARKTTRKAITTPQPLIEEINFPTNLKSVVKDLNLAAAMNPEPSPPPSLLDEQNRIRTMLASFGILPDTTTTTTTTTSMPNAESVADSLSPEMRDLLMNFGLLPDPNPKPVDTRNNKYYPDKAEVKPESYIGFKPLPDNGPSRDDMDALLASFGLGRSARRQKSLKNRPETSTISTEMIPEEFKGIVADLGLHQMQHEKKNVQNMFKSDTKLATDEELKKLDRLIGMIRQIEKLNGTMSEEDMKKFDIESLKEIVGSLNGYNTTSLPFTLDQQGSYLDPNNFDVGVAKNEVKRQESTTASTVSSTTIIEEAKSPSISDLEASFGGQTEAVTEAEVPETTTRKNGFYYLVDWNTFLDIDDTKGRRVNLRFQPTIGDPKRFLSVSVP